VTGRRHLTAALVLGLLACLWFWPLFTGEQLGQSYTSWVRVPWEGWAKPEGLPPRAVYSDAELQFHPWAQLARDQLRDGHLPLWNPYEYAGTVLAGNMQSALFFPPTWLLLVLPLGYAWGVLALLKLLAAGVGAYALARELRVAWEGALLAGIVYMLSAPVMAWLQWPLASGFAVFPWLLLATARIGRTRSLGAVAGVAVAAALLILAGHPETTLMSASAAAVFLIATQRRLGEGLRTGAAWLGGMLLGTAVAAVAVVPFAEAFEPSISRIADSAFGVDVRVPLSYSLHYVLPDLFGDGQPTLYGVDYYQSVAATFGLPALLLAAVALVRYRRDRAALGVAAVGAVGLMAIFGIPPVSWFVQHVPPWSDSVIGSRAFYIPALAGALGAGAGLATLMERPMAPRRIALAIAAAGALVLAAFAVTRLADRLLAPADVQREALAIGLAGLAATAALMLAAGRLSRTLTLTLAGVVAALSLIDLQGYNATLPPDEAHPGTPPALRALQREPGQFRVGVLRTGSAVDAFWPNTGSLYGLETLEGYDFPLSKRWSDFQTAALGFGGMRSESRLAGGVPNSARQAAMRMMNTRYYLTEPGAQPPMPGLETIYEGPDATVFRDRGALPRAYVVPRTAELDYGDALVQLAQGSHDPRSSALVPPGAPAPGPGADGFRPARTEQVAPDHVRVRLPAGSGGWLVLANAYHPNWEAEVDGEPVEIQPTNAAAMGVPVSAGARTVDFRLDRGSFWLGAAISAAALAAVAGLAAAHRRRQGRRAST
jgi:hypothetical protein